VIYAYTGQRKNTATGYSELEKLPNITQDTVVIYYVRCGRTFNDDFITNMPAITVKEV